MAIACGENHECNLVDRYTQPFTYYDHRIRDGKTHWLTRLLLHRGAKRLGSRIGAGDGNRTQTGGASGAGKQALWRYGESQV